MSGDGQMPAGWYAAEGDAPGTKRYWDGSMWIGEPQAMADFSSAPGQAVGGSMGLASVGERLGARVIDALLSFGITAIIVLPGLDFQAIGDAIEAGNDIPDSALPGTGALLLVAIVAFLWDLGWVGAVGGTPGKLLLGMRVVQDQTQEVVGIGAAARRASNRLLGLFGTAGALAGVATLAGIGIGLVSLIFLFTDERRRTVMDKIAGTIVVKK